MSASLSANLSSGLLPPGLFAPDPAPDAPAAPAFPFGPGLRLPGHGRAPEPEPGLFVRVLRGPGPLAAHAPGQRFGSDGGSIGRSRSCTLTLPRTDLHVSREHLAIHWHDGRFMLEVISRHNGAQVNGQPMGPGDAMPLVHGDRIEVGHCLLMVERLPEALPAGFEGVRRSAAARAGGLGDALATAPGAAEAAFDDDVFSTLVQELSPAAAPARRAPAGAADPTLQAVLAMSLSLEPQGLDALPLAVGVRRCGEALRRAVDGLRQMHGARVRLWQAWGLVEARMAPLSRRGPALHDASLADALQRLLQSPADDASAPAPLEEAIAGAAAHERALMAGAREGLRAALACSGPEAVEARMPAPGWLDRCLPIRAAARRWRCLQSLQAGAGPGGVSRAEAAFWQAFARAYEVQFRGLRVG